MNFLRKHANIVLVISLVVLIAGVMTPNITITIQNNTEYVTVLEVPDNEVPSEDVLVNPNLLRVEERQKEKIIVAEEQGTEVRVADVDLPVINIPKPVVAKKVKKKGYDRDIDIILRNEGGYSNDPSDPGGETYAGISRRHHPSSWIWVAVDKAKEAHGGSLPNNYKLHYVHRYLIKFYTRYLRPLDTSDLSADDALIAKELYVNAGPNGCETILSSYRNGSGTLSDHVQAYYQSLYDRGRRHAKYLKSDMRRFGIKLRRGRRGRG